MATRWIGDLSTCFLLENGWAFRVKVNRYHLKGKPGWQMPLSVAEAIALSTGEYRELPCENVDHRLSVERREGSVVVGSIDVPLHRLRCREDDLVFLVFRHDEYTMVTRRQNEVDGHDPLGSLLWCCGLDPTDDGTRADAWRKLARALGGTGSTAAAVSERLRVRGDKRLQVLLQAAAAGRPVTDAATTWSTHWQYVLPAVDDPERFIVQRPDGHARVVLGVMDGTSQTPPQLLLGDGATLWASVAPSDELSSSVERHLRTPPTGLVPAAGRRSWLRWMHAEHAARRASLQGRSWSIRRRGDEWSSADGEFVDVLEALEAIAPFTTDAVREPRIRARRRYPRNSLAFKALFADNRVRRIDILEADGSHGFSARFANGAVAKGATLADVLGPSADNRGA